MSYTQTGDSNHLRVVYDITPDIGQPVYIGDTVTISGTIWHNYKPNDIRSFGVWLGEREVKYINTNIDRNQTTKFSLSFVVENYGTGTTDALLYFRIYNKSGGAGGKSTSTRETNYNESQYVRLMGYSIKVDINKLEFIRASYRNGSYVHANEGTYAICTAFKITGDSMSAFSDMDVKKLTVYSNDVQVYSKSIPNATILSAFSESGYSETSPSILSGYTFAVGNDYRVVLEVGKTGEDLITYATLIPRAFANMHLSGAKKGGVAFGGFSNSTDDDPKLESFYKGYFHNGFDENTCKMIGNILYPVGSIYMNTEDTGPVNKAEQIFGGEWRLIDGGRVLIGPGEVNGQIVSAGDRGGSLNQSISIPDHHHRAPVVVAQYGSEYLMGMSESGCVAPSTDTVTNVFYTLATRGTGRYSGTKCGNTSNVSLEATISASMPPYLVVSIYERTKLYDPITGI